MTTVRREGVNVTDGAVHVTVAPGSTIPSPTFTGTITGAPKLVASWGTPVILASSGSMANNGAVSGMTALRTTYSGGAWLYLPAEAIQAGSAAGFYWFVGSSTTAGTVYNSTWDGSGVPAAGTATAFVSTGPGAFTGIATGEITAATIALAAGAIGPNGQLRADSDWDTNTAAGNKIMRVRLGGSIISGVTIGAANAGRILTAARNANSAAIQKASTIYMSSTTVAGAGALTSTAVNTAAAVNVTFTLEKATATNHVVLEGGTVEVLYAA